MKNNNNSNLIFLALMLVGFVCCTKNNSQSASYTPKHIKLSWDSEYVTMSDHESFATIDLEDRFYIEDTLDARELINPNYIMGDSLKIKIETDAKLIKAEKVIHYYPTMWAGPGDDVLQFIYLFNLECTDTLALSIYDDVINYPARLKRTESLLNEFFGNITRDQLLSSIELVPVEYEKKGTLLSYAGTTPWEADEKVWKRIARKYKSGEFITEPNEPFDISPYEIDLVVTFKGEKGEFTKIFHDEVYVGN